jgi:predicted esterase
MGALAIAVATGCGASDESVGGKAPTTKGATVDQSGSDSANGGTTGSTGGSTDTGSTTDPNGPSAVEVPEPAPFTTTENIKCNPIVAGENTLNANGSDRKFLVQMPQDTTKKMALLFVWHGWLQNSSDFSDTVVYDPAAGEWKLFDPNAFNMPLMIISPVDKNLVPPFGLDWDIVSGKRDFDFFEGMLSCTEQQFKIDTRRVYSFGFSAGAVFSNLVAAKYPHLFAATISESGTWFNDKPEQKEVHLGFVMRWNWPELDPRDRGAVMMTHGGKNDYATVVSLENANNEAKPFLYAAGRDVTECTHEFGHTLEPDITQTMYYQFMWDHQLGAPQPTALTAGMPTEDKPLFNTRCYFHPGQK